MGRLTSRGGSGPGEGRVCGKSARTEREQTSADRWQQGRLRIMAFDMHGQATGSKACVRKPLPSLGEKQAYGK